MLGGAIRMREVVQATSTSATEAPPAAAHRSVRDCLTSRRARAARLAFFQFVSIGIGYRVLMFSAGVSADRLGSMVRGSRINRLTERMQGALHSRIIGGTESRIEHIQCANPCEVGANFAILRFSDN